MKTKEKNIAIIGRMIGTSINNETLGVHKSGITVNELYAVIQNRSRIPPCDVVAMNITKEDIRECLDELFEYCCLVTHSAPGTETRYRLIGYS